MSNKRLYGFVFLVFSSLTLESSLAADEAQDKLSYYNGKRSRETSIIDISGLDKEKLLLALWDNAVGKNLSENNFIGNTIMPILADMRPTEKQLARALAPGKIIDRLQGRVLKVDLSGDEFNFFSYDRDHGTGAALRAVIEVKNQQN